MTMASSSAAPLSESVVCAKETEAKKTEGLMRKANRKDMSAGVMRCVLANNTGHTQHTALMKCNFLH
jgi:hypothetical protein